MTGSSTASGAGDSRRRFLAPSRDEVDARVFQHPLFADFAAYAQWVTAADWPGIDAFNQLQPLPGRQFVAQDAALLADGLHYELRIRQGRIATRLQNWHDLFNAMVWLRHPAIKQALNSQQCLHIERVGPNLRSRAQQALTQFDETGIIVRVRDAAVLAAWDRHDWEALFQQQAAQWHRGDIAIAAVIGHALMEQRLLPGRLLVGKCLVVQGADDANAIAAAAQAIGSGAVLQSPLELRPLPLAGIPGWHVPQHAGFYQQPDYFRPLREGRSYPSPLSTPRRI